MGLGGIVSAVAGSVLGGVLEGNAAEKASGVSAEAAREAAERQEPFRQAGIGATTELQRLLGLTPTTASAGQPSAGGVAGGPSDDLSDILDLAPGSFQNFLQGDVEGLGVEELAKFRKAEHRLLAAGIDPRTEPYVGRIRDLQKAQKAQPSQDVLQRPQRAAEPGSISKLFEETPGFKFQMEQSEKAIRRAGAAGGFRGSGRLFNQLVQNAQGLASTTFQQHLSNLFSLQQVGQAAASGQASSTLARGEAQAAGIIGRQQAISGGISDIFKVIGRQSGAGLAAPGLPQTRITSTSDIDIGRSAGANTGFLEFRR